MRYLLMALLFTFAFNTYAWAQSKVKSLASMISDGYEIKALHASGNILIQKQTSVFVCVYTPPIGRAGSPEVLGQAVGRSLCAPIVE